MNDTVRQVKVYSLNQSTLLELEIQDFVGIDLYPSAMNKATIGLPIQVDAEVE